MIFYDSIVYLILDRHFPGCGNPQVPQMVEGRGLRAASFFSPCTAQPVTACAFHFLPTAAKGIFSRSAAFLFYTRTFTHPWHKRAAAGFILPFMLILWACVPRFGGFCVCFSATIPGGAGLRRCPCPAASRSGSGGAAVPPCLPCLNRPR